MNGCRRCGDGGPCPYCPDPPAKAAKKAPAKKAVPAKKKGSGR